MSVGVFLIVFAFVSGALAFWIDQRFSRLAPGTLRGAVVHVGVSVVVAQLFVPVGLRLVASGASEAATLVGLFAIALPGLTYTLLAAIWIIKTVQRTMRGLPH